MKVVVLSGLFGLLLYTILTKISMRVQVYESSNGESLVQLLKSILLGLRNGHSLGFRLFVRDLKAGLEASLLGYFWIALPALASAGLWIFIQQQKIISIGDTALPYPVFVLIGTTCWTVFAESVNKPIQRYKSAMSLMVKLNFPREAIFVSAIYDLLFSLVLKVVVLFVIIAALGVVPSIGWVGILFFALGSMFIGVSFGLLISPFGVLLNDFSRAINMVMPFIMYLTPVVFTIQSDSFLGKMQVFNPVTPWIESARNILTGAPIDVYALGLWVGISIVLSLIGLMLMRIALPIIVERAGS